MFLLLSFSLYAQTVRGYLSEGDSIKEYRTASQWVMIVLVDSASTADSAIVEKRSVFDRTTTYWTPIGVKDLVEDEVVQYLVPGVNVNGRAYLVWLPYPQHIRLRKIDVAQLSEKLYYIIYDLP